MQNCIVKLAWEQNPIIAEGMSDAHNMFGSLFLFKEKKAALWTWIEHPNDTNPPVL